MTDETGREIHSPDVVNVEEFLFGGVTQKTEDDAPGDACGEIIAGDADATVDAGDPETAQELDEDVETAAFEPDVTDGVDEGREQPAPAETKTSEELKVVLSIWGNRAVIGVQRPSADPHIESFDSADLFGLADEFPAVVARAKARWEEEPRYPAHVKPAPPARQRNRRQHSDTQAAAAEGEAEAELPPARNAAVVLWNGPCSQTAQRR